jgi:hypothetical protein
MNALIIESIESLTKQIFSMKKRSSGGFLLKLL